MPSAGITGPFIHTALLCARQNSNFLVNMQPETQSIDPLSLCVVICKYKFIWLPES